MITERKSCRACLSPDLALVLDLGKTPLANDFLRPEEIKDYTTCLPLRFVVCRKCSLAQLGDSVSPEVLYSHYAYVTSTSRTMDEHLTGQKQHLLGLLGDRKKPRVLEIASNTGLYLKKFQESGCEVLGFEPAANIAKIAQADGVPTKIEFFDSGTAAKLQKEWGKADLIIGRHVFAHIEDLKGLLTALDSVSHDGTLIAFEVPYMLELFKRVEFDTIYHEHLSYVSIRAIEALTAGSPFFLKRIDYYPIHGGSILFQLQRRGGKEAAHESVARYLQAESELRLEDPKNWEPFVAQVRRVQTELPALIRRLKSEGKRIIGYGASAKGNTLLNTCGLTSKDLDYIIDNTPFKQGKVAPGSWIPIRPPEALLQDKPDYALLLAWNFAKEIIGRETRFQQSGGRFILPLPMPGIVEYP